MIDVAVNIFRKIKKCAGILVRFRMVASWSSVVLLMEIVIGSYTTSSTNRLSNLIFWKVIKSWFYI